MKDYWSELSRKVKNISGLFDEFATEGDLEKTISLVEYTELYIEVTTDKLQSEDIFQLYYSLGVAYSDIYKSDSPEKYEILQEKELLNYRNALRVLDEEEINTNIMIPQLYINTGNAYFNVGRVMESLNYYDMALTLVPNHPMAWGCKGKTLEYMAKLIYDNNHKNILIHEAYRCLCLAEKNKEVYPYPPAHKVFRELLKTIEEYFDYKWLNEKLEFENYVSNDEKEREYKVWCRKNNLFLNELNEVLDSSVIEHDPLHMPSIVTTLKFDSRLHGFMNQIKQDYVSTRFLYFDSHRPNEQVHFSDRGVHQVNTLDYAIHSLSDFKVKAVFKSAHSLFDKIAFFMNEYFDIGIKERDVNFNTVWKTEHGVKKRRYQYKNPINQKALENPSLKGLYWIAKDFYPIFNSIIEPKSEIIRDIRNHLEHKYVKTADVEPPPDEVSGDNMAYYITSEELLKHTITLLKLSRDAIIYLIMAIHVEEKFREESRKNGLFTVPINLTEIDDEWKL